MEYLTMPFTQFVQEYVLQNPRIHFTSGEKEVFDTILITSNGFSLMEKEIYMKAGSKSDYPLSIIQLASCAYHLLKGERVQMQSRDIEKFRGMEYYYFQIVCLLTPIYEPVHSYEYQFIDGSMVPVAPKRNILYYIIKLRSYHPREKNYNVQQDTQPSLPGSDEITAG